MLKYKNKGYLIEIELPKDYGYNGYSVECSYFYDKICDKYLLSMWLKHNSIGDKLRIESQEIDTQYISSKKETIKKNICAIVEQMCLGDFFDYYVERYEYMNKCFDRGNELFEEERISNHE